MKWRWLPFSATEGAGRNDLALAASTALAGAVADLDAGPRQDRPIAVLEIGDLVGEGRERERVRAEIHLALAVPDGERRAVPRADELVLLAGEQEGEREGAAQARQRRGDRLRRGAPLAHLEGHELRHDLGVGLGLEDDALALQLGLELAEILDDAVMDDGELLGRVRMGVDLVRLAVRRPARVADADRARQRRLRQLQLEVAQLALGAAALEPAVSPAWRRRRNRSRGIRAASARRRPGRATADLPRIPTMPHMT